MSLDHEFVPILAALLLLIAAWIAVRLRMRQSPLHLWLGAAVAAAIAVTAGALHGFGGMIADLIMVAAALFSGYAFTVGVRCESLQSERACGAVLGGFAACLALALLLELTVGDDALRSSILRLIIGLEFLSALLWIPELLRGHVPRPATAGLAVLAAVLAIAVMTQSFVSAAIVIGGIGLVAFSISRAGVARLRR